MLADILEHAQARAESASALLAEFRAAAADAAPVRPFSAALCRPGLQVVAEVKRRSPSAGDLAPDLDPVAQARRYEAGGAAALSVLTEPDFFNGSLHDLEQARGATTLPTLRKDFLLDEAQIWEARAAGADAVLLIVATLDDEMLRRMLDAAAEAAVEALVEVHAVDEAARAVAAGAAVVGVNNRDLHTFVTDPAVAERIAGHLGGVAVTIAESGVSSAAVARRMERAGYDAVLVGEALVRSADPAALIRELRGVPCPG